MIDDINRIIDKLDSEEIKYLINYIISYHNFVYYNVEEIIEIK